MCSCSDDKSGVALFEALQSRQEKAEQSRLTHKIEVWLCDGSKVSGDIEEVAEGYVVLEVSSSRGVKINEFVRYCCVCRVNEYNANG